MKRTDIYDKYMVMRTDGRDDPNAIYFVLRIDRLDNWWDQWGRWTLRKLARRLMSDGDPNKNKFGENLENWILTCHMKAVDGQKREDLEGGGAKIIGLRDPRPASKALTKKDVEGEG